MQAGRQADWLIFIEEQDDTRTHAHCTNAFVLFCLLFFERNGSRLFLGSIGPLNLH